jgi:hypothetical protein
MASALVWIEAKIAKHADYLVSRASFPPTPGQIGGGEILRQFIGTPMFW